MKTDQQVSERESKSIGVNKSQTIPPTRLVPLKHVSERQRERVSEMLAYEWPEGGGKSARLSSLKRDSGGVMGGGYCLVIAREGGECVSEVVSEGEVEVVGYAKVEASKSTGVDSFGNGVVGIVTSVVVANNWRTRGLGVRLMGLLESVTAQEGFHYLYLWASEDIAKGFYGKVCGFSVCQQEAGLVSAALDRLEEKSVGRLESMLSRRMTGVGMRNSAINMSNEVEVNTRVDSEIDSGGGEGSRQDKVRKMMWMSKRINFEDCPLQYYSCESDDCVGVASSGQGKGLGSWKSALCQSMLLADPVQQQAWLGRCRGDKGEEKDILYEVISCMRFLPWTQQIGPSCGIQAARMVSRALQGLWEAGRCDLQSFIVTPSSLPTQTLQLKCRDSPRVPSLALSFTPQFPDVSSIFNLLPWAVQRGYSSHGELFDIAHLVDVLERQLREDIPNRGDSTQLPLLDIEVKNFAELGWRGVHNVLTSSEAPGFVILPYDRDRKRGSKPCLREGLSAHYAVLCGVIIPQEGSSSWDERAEGDVVSLIAIQSMSPNPVVATYTEWSQSNLQLLGGTGPLSSDCRGDDEEDDMARAVLHLRNSRGWTVSSNGSTLQGNCVVARCVLKS